MLCSLLNIDTDGFIYEVFTANLYEDMFADLNTFDTSNYPTDHFILTNNNNKVPGKFKAEKAEMLPKSYACPKPKMISLEVVSQCGSRIPY